VRADEAGVSTSWIDKDALAASAETAEPLPHTVARLAGLVADPDSDIREIAEVVSLDVSLTADLLRRVNSAALGGLATITSVRDAAVRLGRSNLLSLALASAVGRTMSQALPAYGLQAGELWERSVAASVAGEVIRTRAGADVPAEAGTAALLHDFGKVVLARHYGDRILDMVDLAAAHEGLDLLAAERAIFGLTHAEIGAAVAETWQLPATIVDGIGHHHDVHHWLSPVGAAVSLACSMSFDITVLADATELEQRSQAERLHTQAPLFAILRLHPDTYVDLLAEARDRFQEIADRYRS
jgi:HD-like signal output (HDOD) protein